MRTIFLLSVTCLLCHLGQSTAQYAPGVPPPRTRTDEIKFHEPEGPLRDTASPQQQQLKQQEHQMQQKQYQQQQGQPVQGQGTPQHQEDQNLQKQYQQHHRKPYKPRHKDININLEKEREHIKAQVKEEHIDINSLDDTKLLMQYFRKHDTDNNHKLDGLELLKAIARMEEEHSHSDEEDDDHDDDQQAGPDDHPGDGPLNIDIEQIIPIVDSILEQDDKNKDGYLNYAEFMSRQKQHMRS